MDKVQFSCKLETVARKEVLVSLFQSAGNQVADGTNNEFLMHLDAKMPDQGNEKVQEAEFIIIVDRLVMLCVCSKALVALFAIQINIDDNRCVPGVVRCRALLGNRCKEQFVRCWS